MTSFKPSFSVAFWLPLSIFMFFSVSVFGQTLPESNLVKDINVGSASSAPNNFISLNGKTYFKATPVTGSLSKIMVTDGTEVGTTVAAFSPANVSLFSDMVLFNNQIYWLAEQAGSITLWKTADGNSTTFVDTIASANADTTYNLNNNFNTQPFVANNNLVLHYVKHYAPFSYNTDLHYYAYSNGLKGGTRNVGIGEKRYTGTTTPSSNSTKFVGNNNIFFVNLVENYSNGYYTIELKSNFNTNQIIANNYSVFGAPPRNINLVGLGTINDNFIGVFNDSLVNITTQGQKTVLKTGCSEIEFLAQINNQIYFRINYRDIFRTDGTASGTIQIPTSNISLSVKMKINDTLFVASSNNEDRYEIWKIDNSKTDFQRVFLLEGPKLGILTYAINNKIFMGNNVGNKTTLYEPDFSRNKLRMLGQIDRLNQLGSIQSGSILVASGDNDQTVAINTNVKGIELKSLNLNPSVVQYPCLADTIKPQWYSCPNNFIISQPQGFCIGTVLERPNAFDNCGIPITAVKAIKGSFIPDSQWNNGKPSYNLCPYDVYDTITYYARDLSYNVGQCSFTAIARLPNPCSSDVTPPTFARCPTDTIINANQPTIVNWTTPAVSDNCGIPSLGVNYTSGSTFPMGVTRVIYTATDVANNTAVCSFNVTVSNPTNPVNCASNAQSPWNEWIKEVKIDTFINVSEKVRSDRYAVGYSDFKDKIIPLKRGDVYLMGLIAGVSYPSYQTQVFFSAWIDFNGNNIFEDTEKIFGSSGGNVGGTFYIPLTAKSGNTVLRISMKKDGLSAPCETFAAGEVEDYTINILANNNCDTDTTPPFYYNCPENITLTTTGTTAVATWVTPTATDNCGTPSVLSDYNSGFAFPLGTTVVTYTFADAKANKRTCNFNVSVSNSNPCLNDLITPVLLNCPTNISLTTTGTSAIATWTTPTATDNCSTPSVSSTYNSGFAFPIGLTTVSYTATDAKANKSTCSFTVTVTQQVSNSDICTNPTANVVGGAGAISVTGITTSSAAIQVFTSTWNSVFNQQVSGTSATIPNLAVGKYIVKVTVLGAGGKWPAVCNVQVENVSVTSGTNPCATDVTPPTFTNCPTNINLTTTGTTALATWIVPTATDNCGTPSVLSNYNSGFAFPLGTTAVTYTATDAKGNKATCSFNVVVAQSIGCRQRDSLILMDIYNNMGGSNSVFGKWDLSTPINTWYGVTLNSNGCVVDLGLWTFAGNLVPSIGNLSELEALHLNGNGTLTGTLPTELGNLKKLKFLEANGNKFTGSIPASFGNLTNMEDLRLYSNQLTGTIPTELGNLKKVKTFLLYLNQLSGEIPSSLGGLDSVQSFLVSNNKLTGKIPNSLGNLKNVVLLDFGTNLLTDTLPKIIASLPKLALLRLQNNLLNGCIPTEFKTLCGKEVDLSNNPNLLGGGDWAAFCSSNTGICPTITNDLELTMSSNPSVFNKWTTINTVVTLKNKGNSAFTNIEVNVPAPKGTSAGGTGLPTIGTWQPYCSGGVLCYKWTIPSLAANATATLTIPLFVLNVDTPIVATAKLLTSLPVDNNVVNNTATVTIAPASTQQIQGLSIRKPTQYIPVIIQKISPNPTDGDVYIDVESLDERDMRFEFFNAQGQEVYNEMQHLKKGSNQLYFNITDKESGLYFVKPETSGGRNVPVKFVKM